MTVRIAALSEQPLDFASHAAAVSGEMNGAVASFTGLVRNHDPGASGEVNQLDYSAHPDAEAKLREIAASLDAPGLEIAVSHRTGTLAVGDIAIVACVGSAHRAEAFDVCRELVETVKRELPVWKRQHTVDGATNWVGIV
ncbi:molybdenum cofactor biosynthesis protein MoaE [Gulosibacter molinativorax]|uniref:Molybdenum cofactor biosynthesis protein MoaE n=1 Tax=Gulosibacter molinativorax TaxID=256821 RepID=A0ABT7CC33_9MICO|nr:molybdenum cofactor biosynthesis protein MoaE [Gulosibacter molinativorax]MDJ1372359.1 molybdenum cofactor biosynthesis protein MoaE [Gulosibacter molinativorax]QUY63552.1 Molybdopterin synthase large subunit MoaE [Gulosibacter molinativorax]